MNYEITIKEIRKMVIDVEANSFDEAREKAEADYWKNPNDYIFEPEDIFFE